jgi:hypothetical protein
MKIDVKFEKAINHQQEVADMIEKGYRQKMKPIEMLHRFVLYDMIESLSPTQQLFIERVMQMKNCDCDIQGAYEKGVNDMTIEVRSMAKYIKKRLTK